MIITINTTLIEAVCHCPFSVLHQATRTYLSALVAIAQTFCIEIAELTMQAGYDRADWFYGVWAIAHYSEMPETQIIDELEPDYWFEPLETMGNPIVLEPLHRLLNAPTSFQPFGLLPPAPVQFIGMTIRELRAIARERGIRKYGSLSKARLVEVLS